VSDRITVGTCSICGGPVTVPIMWHGIIPPKRTCCQCGAVAAEAHGPVIQMEPASGPPVRIEWETTSGVELTNPDACRTVLK
jgi:hypothetical protein